MKVTSLNIYPVKSFGGYGVEHATLSDRGFASDRRWVLVDEHGVAITQRQVPQLALLQVEDRGNEMAVRNVQNGEQVVFAKEVYSDNMANVDIFGTVIHSNVVSPDLDAWFGRQIGKPCRFVYMPENVIRPLKEKYQDPTHSTYVSFVDGYQYLLATETSLADVSRRVGETIEMNRFRPNIVVDGLGPWEEDGWRKLAIGDVILQYTKPCGRCSIPTVDQKTGEKGKEPMKTLATFRKFGSNVHFGIYLRAPLSEIGKSIRVGDEVRVLE